MKIETRCKFCQREIEIEVDARGFENPVINMSVWLKHIACNRCADYAESKRDIVSAISRLCQVAMFSGGDLKVLGIVREKLQVRTKELCELICDHKLIQFIWDEEIVNLLMEQPGKLSRIINQFTAQLNRIRDTATAP